MATLTIHNASFVACSLVLGEEEHHIDHEPRYYNNDLEALAKMKASFGFGTRYTARAGTTTCDLCGHAARRLMQTMHLAPSDIGALVFVTQTPDYLMPGNAHVLHGRLGLSTETPALDVEMGCSGFVYGLWLASMMASSGIDNVLLLVGDTISRITHPNDKTTAPLFGDAGSASLIRHTPGAPPMHFVLRSDGTKVAKLLVPAGAFRTPSSPETQKEIADAAGNIRTQEHLFMDGFTIYQFSVAEQPSLLNALLEYAGKTEQDIDYLILHQANRHIVESIGRKSGFPPEKVPSEAFTRFGNQNAASIPGVLCGCLADTLKNSTAQVVLQGFGVGLSWGACQLALDHVVCLPPVTFEGE